MFAFFFAELDGTTPHDPSRSGFAFIRAPRDSAVSVIRVLVRFRADRLPVTHG
jgi:hypothetical protein